MAPHMTTEERTALAAFGITNARLHTLPSISNRIWQARAGEERFVLRIAPAAQCSAERLDTEFRWLRAIRDETDLYVPYPLTTLTGKHYHQTSHSNCASLFTWLPGETLTTADLDTNTLNEIGGFVAQLHTHSANFRLAPPLSPVSMLANDLFGPNSPYLSMDSTIPDSILSEKTSKVIAAVADRFLSHLSPLDNDATATGMIHGDLVAKNWLRGPAELALIDFDHCGWGYFIYDLAALCIQLLDEVDFPQRRAALLAGYTSQRPLPHRMDELLDICIVARYAASCLWMAREARKPAFATKARAAIVFRTEQMRRYLDSGRLPSRGQLF